MEFLGSPSTGVTPVTGDRTKKFVTAEMLGQELLAKLETSAYTAEDVLAKLLTVDTNTSGLNASTLRGTTPGTTGASVLAAATQAAARTAIGADPALGYTPVQQNGGTGHLTNKIYLGWSGFFPKMQIDLTDLGRVWTDAEAARTLALVGYQKLPGGLMIQWGSQSAGDGASITFPVAFPTRSCAVIPAVTYSSAGTAETATAFVSASSSTAFTVRTRFANNGGLVGTTSSYTINWIAIGY